MLFLFIYLRVFFPNLATSILTRSLLLIIHIKIIFLWNLNKRIWLFFSSKFSNFKKLIQEYFFILPYVQVSSFNAYKQVRNFMILFFLFFVISFLFFFFFLIFTFFFSFISVNKHLWCFILLMLCLKEYIYIYIFASCYNCCY